MTVWTCQPDAPSAADWFRAQGINPANVVISSASVPRNVPHVTKAADGSLTLHFVEAVGEEMDVRGDPEGLLTGIRSSNESARRSVPVGSVPDE